MKSEIVVAHLREGSGQQRIKRPPHLEELDIYSLQIAPH